MRRRLALLLLASTTIASTSIALGACSSSEPTPSFLPVSDDDGGPGKPKRDGSSIEIPDGADPPLPDGGKPPGRVYAHTRDTLYLFEPNARTITAIGKFSCVPANDSVIDIALDRTGKMYGTTFTRFLSIDPVTADCTVIEENTTPNYYYPNSLSFVPQGTVDPNEEALVGYALGFDGTNASIFTRIDLQTGAMSDIGDLNPCNNPPYPACTEEYALAGDFISIIRGGAKTYALLKRINTDAGTGNDELWEIDPKTGVLKTKLGVTGTKGLFGFGYWAGKGYAFGSDGRVFEIDMTNGQTTVVQTLTVDGGSASWYGAGVTTDSPTAPTF